MQDTQNNKFRKVAKLTSVHKKALNVFEKDYTTQEDIASEFGLPTSTYLRIKELGRGNSDNVGAIISKLIEKNLIAA